MEPSVVRIFGVRHDGHSVEEYENRIEDFITQDTEAIFTEYPPDDELNIGEETPEKGRFVTSFLVRDVVTSIPVISFIMIVQAIMEELLNAIREQRLPSRRYLRVRRDKSNEWRASKNLVKENDMGHAKIDKPFTELTGETSKWNILLLVLLPLVLWLFLYAGFGVVLAGLFFLLFSLHFLLYLGYSRTITFENEEPVSQVSRGIPMLILSLSLWIFPLSFYWIWSYSTFWFSEPGSYVLLSLFFSLYVFINPFSREILFTHLIRFGLHEREEYMMERVRDECQSNGYDEVCLVVGGSHIEGLKEMCQDESIKVKTRDSRTIQR